MIGLEAGHPSGVPRTRPESDCPEPPKLPKAGVTRSVAFGEGSLWTAPSGSDRLKVRCAEGGSPASEGTPYTVVETREIAPRVSRDASRALPVAPHA